MPARASASIRARSRSGGVMLQQIQLNKKIAVVISVGFALLIGAGLWWRMNQTGFNARAYYEDAARLQEEEKYLDKDGKPVPAPQGSTPRDQAYQPEKGKD